MLGGLNNKYNLLLTVLEAGGPWSRSQSIWGLVKAFFLVGPLLTVSSHIRERERIRFLSSSNKVTNPIRWEVYSYDFFLTLITLHWVLELQYTNLEGGVIIQSMVYSSGLFVSKTLTWSIMSSLHGLSPGLYL